MSERLGKRQLRLLMNLGAPSVILLTPDKTAESLRRRGLVAPYRGGGALRITSAGLRALAEALEAGALEQFMRRPASEKAAEQ